MILGSEMKEDPEWFEAFYQFHDHSYQKNKSVEGRFTKEDLSWRLKFWMFFGDLPQPGQTVAEATEADAGYVIANNKTKFMKLVGAGGSLAGQLKGLDELLYLEKPIFGAIEPRLAKLIVKKKPEFILADKSLLKELYSLITSSSEFQSGGNWDGFNNDGTIGYNLGGEIGIVQKAIIGTQSFFDEMKKKEGLISKLGNLLEDIL